MSASCVILVPVNGSPVPECEEGLRELERRGYRVWRVRGYSAIDAARCQMATDALAQNFDELFWIDSDIVFDPNDVDRLRRHDLPFVCGLYAKKGSRQFAASFLPGTEQLLLGKDGRLAEIQGCGFGFTLTRRVVYETMQRDLQLPVCNEKFGKKLVPYFWPTIAADGPGTHWYLSEDLAFCARARHVGFPVVADLGVRLWHVGSYKYGWEDAGSEKERYESYRFNLPKATAPPALEYPRLVTGPAVGPPQPIPAAPAGNQLLAPPRGAMPPPPPAAKWPRTALRGPAAPLPEGFPRFRAYVVTYAANLESATLTMADFEQSDWGEPATLFVQPEDWPVGLDSAARNYKRALQAAADDGCDFALILEDDVRVNRHVRRNLSAIPLVQRDQCDYLSLYIPDLVAAPWERAEPHLGYRLARPLYSGPNRMWAKHRLWGSQGYLLSRRFVLKALERWDRLKNGLDTRVISVCSELKLPMWYTDPCLVQHRPLRSAHATPTAHAPDFRPDHVLDVRPGYQPPEEVPGWLTHAEGGLLWEVANGRHVLELGTAGGRATVCLAQQAASVLSLDTAEQTEAAEWVRRYGVADKVTFAAGNVGVICDGLRQTFDLILIDLEHDAKSVTADIERALPLLRPDGLLAFHDYPDPAWPDVRRVADDYAARCGWERVRQADYLGVFRVPDPTRRPPPAGPTDADVYEYFRPRWTPAELDRGRQLLAAVGAVLAEIDAPWFLYGGTLLGHAIDGTVLPWDDDLDVITVGPFDPDRVRSAAARHGLRTTPHPHPGYLKLFFANDPPVAGKPWAFPFLDLCHGAARDGQFVHKSVWGGAEDAFPIAAVLPVRSESFAGVPAGVPADAAAVCRAKYGPDCLTSAVPPSWDHRAERPTNYPAVRVPLDRIRAVVAAVSSKG
jgi:hypothetical protein